MKSETPYQKFTLAMALNLAAPHTWAAAILPVLIACAASLAVQGSLSIIMAICLLAICILMQSATNVLNDYFDYVKGVDSKDDALEESDAVLLYNNINPKAALYLAICFLLFALLLGLYVIYRAGLIPLIIGIIGAFVVVFYSFGKKSISYLPLGEVVSGFVMGGLIMLASYHALTLSFEPRVLIWSIPLIIGIGLIMMTNNTCDIEKDIQAGRHTLPSLLGRKRAVFLYRFLLLLWLLAVSVLIGIYFTTGVLIIPFMLLASYPLLKALFANPLQQASRIAAMSQIVSVNITLGAFYAAGILASGFALTLF